MSIEIGFPETGKMFAARGHAFGLKKAMDSIGSPGFGTRNNPII